MSEVKDGLCIIDAMSGIDCATPQIGQFTDNFDRVKFLLGKDFSDYTMMIITDISGHVEVVNTDGDNLIKETIDGETYLLWNIGINITTQSGVIVYQIAAYKREGDGIEETWYSKEGRLVVTESISTNEYSASLIGSYPNLLTRLLIETDNLKTDVNDIRRSKVDVKDGFGLSENSFSDQEKKKLLSIEEGAEVNVQPDWQETDKTSDSYIKNKPLLSDVALSGKYDDLKGTPKVDISYDGESYNAQSGKAVKEAIARLISSSPETLDTLYELSKALGNDPNFAETVAKEIGKKVDKEEGKVLSSNDYTDAEKEKLSSVERGAEKNVMSDWAEEDANSDRYIKNKPVFSPIALSGSYNDLTEKPNIPSTEGLASEEYVNAGLEAKVDKATKINGKVLSGDVMLSAEDVNALPSHTPIPSLEGLASEEYVNEKLDKKADTSDLAKVALSGSYNDLTDKPTVAGAEGLASLEYVDEGFDEKADALKFETERARAIRLSDSSGQKIDSLTIYGRGDSAENPTVKISGKNLIPFPYIAMSKEHNGVTFTVNADGTVTANGTATAQAYIAIANKAGLGLTNGSYCLSGTPYENNEDSKCYISYAGKAQDGRSDVILNIDDSIVQNLMTCVVSSGKTVNNFVFNPMLESLPNSPQSVTLPFSLGEDDTLTMTEKTVKTNIGGVETDITDTETGQAILALHTNLPDTTVLCDCEAELSYKADTTIAFQRLKQAILSLGGNI